MNLGEERFADVSALVNLDSDRDGRAFSSVDFDRDGDLDLIVKNRNTPRLRLLRNDFPDVNHSIAFKLIGSRSNRDAVGAKVQVVTSKGTRSKFVRMGSGFLSQSSNRVFFGLGESDQVERVDIFWPTGRQESFKALAADQLVTVQEGKGIIRSDPFHRRSGPPALRQATGPQPPENPGARGNWLVEPVPAPDLEGRDLEGNKLTLARWRGQYVLLNFWATWCAPCQKELTQWSAAYPRLQKEGAEIVAVSVDEPGTEENVRQFVTNGKLSFPVLLPDAASVHVYNIFHRNLLRRPRNLQIPTTYLLNPRGEVIKIYRGRTPPRKLLHDLGRVPSSTQERLAASLPYPGRAIHLRQSRDYVRLAFSLMNAGRSKAAQQYLPRALQSLRTLARKRADHKMVHLYRGVAALASGQTREAQTALERALEIDPTFVDAHFNLGVVYRQLGRPRQALTAWKKTVSLDPGFADAYFNLALTYRSLGQPHKALAALQRRRQLAPDDPETHNELGVVLTNLGRLAEAIRSFERAVELDRESVDSLRNLGVVYYQKKLFTRAVEALEQAHQLAPNDDDIVLSLAVAYSRTGQVEKARSLLQALLEENPRQSLARELLRELQHFQDAR